MHAHGRRRTAARPDGAPAFYRATFRRDAAGSDRAAPDPAGHDDGPVARLRLAQRPQPGPLPGKECRWTACTCPNAGRKSGRNELVIFDEEGHSPAQVKLRVEQAASRIVVPMTEK